MVQGRVWVRLYRRMKNKCKLGLVKVKSSRRLGVCCPRNSGATLIDIYRNVVSAIIVSSMRKIATAILILPVINSLAYFLYQKKQQKRKHSLERNHLRLRALFEELTLKVPSQTLSRSLLSLDALSIKTLGNSGIF